METNTCPGPQVLETDRQWTTARLSVYQLDPLLRVCGIGGTRGKRRRVWRMRKDKGETRFFSNSFAL